MNKEKKICRMKAQSWRTIKKELTQNKFKIKMIIKVLINNNENYLYYYKILSFYKVVDFEIL